MRYICIAALLTTLALAGEIKQSVALIYKGERGGFQVFAPVFAPEFGLEQEAGPIPVRGELENCVTSIRTKKAVVDGKDAEIRELVLTCKSGRRYAVRAVNFEAK